MRQSHKLIGDALWNLAGHIARLLAVFLLPPFVISYIGKDNYGIIVVATTVMSFVSLVQIGTPNALSRFLSEAVALGNDSEANKIINSGCAILTMAGLAASIVTLIVAILPQLFVASPKGISTSTARLVMSIMGGLAALSLPLSLANVLYYVKGRFGLLNGLQIMSSLFRVLLVLLFVWLYRNSVAYVSGHAIASIVFMFIISIVGIRIFKGVHLGTGFVDKKLIRKILGYGTAVFVYNSLYLLYIQADYLIIGKMINSTAVTLFNLAVIWGISLRGIIVSVVSVAVPAAARQNARRDTEAMKQLLLRITKYSLLICMPGIIFLISFHDRLMLNWMGPGFEEAAFLIAPIMIGELFVIAEAGGTQICLGIGKLRFLTLSNVVFGLANVILTFLCCSFFDLGLKGVAYVYMSLLFLRSGILTPIYMARELGVTAAAFYRISYYRPFLAALLTTPFVIMIYNFFPRLGWLSFCLSGCLVMLVYIPAAYYVALDSYDKGIMRQLIKKYFSIAQWA
jgi:O-antigen/teichoic acid export membrane protein